MRTELAGQGASRGMALGRAHLEQPGRQVADERPLAGDEVEGEVERLARALATARDELQSLRDKLHGALAREVAEFIDAHSLILADRELTDSLFDLVRIGHYRASAALQLQRDRIVAMFDAMDDPYLRSRKEDIRHVIGRVQAALTRTSSDAERRLAARVGMILVSDSIAPSELVPLAEQGTLGVVARTGSPLSHSAILSRSLRLPMAVGVRDALSAIQEDDLVLIDGDKGTVVVHPTAQDIAGYRAWQRDMVRQGKRLALLRNADTRTRDGIVIDLHANAELDEDVAQARLCGASGIGLYRTEFLFLQRRELPGEEEQFRVYRDVVLAMSGAPVTIRLLDLGADKAGASGLAVDDEANPALGVRGVRLVLRRPDVLATQLRAILRASEFGRVRVLVPMVTVAEEMVQVRAALDACARDLRSAGHEIGDQIDLGAMIEVPAAAIGLRPLANLSDFLALGTNDLMQYTLAVDRNNDQLADLYDPLHPAVLALIARSIRVSRRAGKPITLCGEMAGDTRYTALLLALGLAEFSVHPGVLLEVREKIGSLDAGALRKRAPALLRAPSRERVARVLDEAVATSG